MKNTKYLIAIIILIAVCAFKSPTIDTNVNSSKGIHFFKGTFQKALQKAKEENKPIFLDMYTTWCGPCKLLKRKTFLDKEVGDYFNERFINITVDAETTIGQELSGKYNIEGYPTLLILDKEGNKLAKQIGFVEPHILVNFGKRIAP